MPRRSNPTQRINRCSYSSKKSLPTPRVNLSIRDRVTGSRFDFKCLPDTGATRTIISKDLADKYGITINGKKKEKLLNASGQPMPCEGTAPIRMSLEGDRPTRVYAIVSSAMKKEILVSWHDLQTLGVIGPNFPSRD
jgi:hypothetical protein